MVPLAASAKKGLYHGNGEDDFDDHDQESWKESDGFRRRNEIGLELKWDNMKLKWILTDDEGKKLNIEWLAWEMAVAHSRDQMQMEWWPGNICITELGVGASWCPCK